LPLTAAEDRRVYGSIMKLRKEMMKLWYLKYFIF